MVNGKDVPLHFRATVVAQTINTIFNRVICEWSASTYGYGSVTFSSYSNFAGGDQSWIQGRIISKNLVITGP